jgi:hypothetical protein
MEITQYVPFLKTFALIVFDLFFLIMIFVSLYSVFVISTLKKQVTNLLKRMEHLIENTKKESTEVAQVLKEKAETLNLSNVAIIGSLIGGIFMTKKKLFAKKSATSTFINTLLKLLK